MPDIFTRLDLPSVRASIAARLAAGQVAILPTDTIYGLSGNALDPAVVDRILSIKRRRKPVSFIPHSIDWARLLIDPADAVRFDEVLERHRGPFTTLWRRGSGYRSLPRALCTSGLVGLRLPDHWITDLAHETALPLVTTSVNLTRRPYMSSLDNLDDSIRRAVDFIVYEGPLTSRPSTIVRVHGNEPFPQEAR